MAGALPGDLLVLANRIFTGHFETSRSGTPTLGIGLCGSSQTVIDVNDLGRSGLRLEGANYWTVAGFTITGGLFGIFAAESSHNRITGMTIHGIGQEAIIFRRSSSQNVIEGNTIYDTGLTVPEFGEGVYLGTSYGRWENGDPDRSDGNIIIGNTFGPNVRAEHIDVKEGTTGGLIANNAFDGAGMIPTFAWGPHSWVTVQGNGYTIRENSGTRAVRHGFKVFQELPGWGNGNVFSKNTADVGAEGFGFLIDLDTSGNIVLCDNVVLNAGSGLANIQCLSDLSSPSR
ncbi:right-handed parallel beta-helix repeat-containing protein [Gemmatimonadota bacterium]